MDSGQTKLRSGGDKRLVLVVEDVEVNRLMLESILKDTYDVIFALDGEEALATIEENKHVFSLVFLDLIMPNVSGQDVLYRVKANPDYQDIPVIVASGDRSQEILCINAGASDFIQKPYPEPGIILARARRAIELFEGRKIIHSTERDPLTGLYNREYFFSYADQFDQHHLDTPMDAIVLDINNFSIINERHGRAYADDILCRVGEKAREMVHDSGGIVCRREADIFYVYCPHRQDYKAILDNASIGLTTEHEANKRIRLRMGVYSNVDKTIELERRFDRAKSASDSVRNSFTRNIGVYDDTLHKAELYSARLIDEFADAIEQGQFKVFFQPKFDITGDTPRLVGAEGLVRWQHPELGMISPGIFIPLFEDNGLIQTLDHYVWRESARQVRRWKDELGFSVPVSVNVSRIDMYETGIVYDVLEILEESKLEPPDLHLEVTESAYAEDAEQIIECVRRLRAMGFLVEMDDFGTGYSSLNMLSSLPIDVLKLDMRFIATAFSQEKDTHMLEVIIQIARHLHAPVVAEGVETEEQVQALREIGCDMVQGYYFSPPVPADRFTPFLVEAAQAAADRDAAQDETRQARKAESERAEGSVLSRLSERLNISLRSASLFFLAVSLIASAALFIADQMVTNAYLRTVEADDAYAQARQAATDLETGSDILTSAVCSFVVTGDIDHLTDYFVEADETRRRDHAVESLESMTSADGAAYASLSEALRLSNELMEDEFSAMRLILSNGDYDRSRVPDVVDAKGLTPEEEGLTAQERRAKAIDLVYGERYESYKQSIMENAEHCTEEVIRLSGEARVRQNDLMNRLLGIQTALTVCLFTVVLAIVAFIGSWVRRPLTRMVAHMRTKELVPPTGASELRFVAETYN